MWRSSIILEQLLGQLFLKNLVTCSFLYYIYGNTAVELCIWRVTDTYRNRIFTWFSGSVSLITKQYKVNFRKLTNWNISTMQINNSYKQLFMQDRRKKYTMIHLKAISIIFQWYNRFVSLKSNSPEYSHIKIIRTFDI